MNLTTILSRAARSVRNDSRLHIFAIGTLSVAFAALFAVLWIATNARSLTKRLEESAHLSVFLRDDVVSADVESLRMALSALPQVASVAVVDKGSARAALARSLETDAESIPLDLVPALLDVNLRDDSQIDAIAARVERFRFVEDVETYRATRESVATLSKTLSGLSVGLSSLVLFCVLLVISSTVRLSLARRKDEIEVMRLCGASDSFVRGPFVAEGAFGAGTAVLCSLLLFSLIYVVFGPSVSRFSQRSFGIEMQFLPMWTVVFAIVVSTGVGAIASVWALRRHMVV